MRSATEIEEAVREIGLDVWREIEGVEYFNIIFSTDGFHQKVTFCDIELWNCEDDEDEDKSIEDILRKRLSEELDKLHKITGVYNIK